MVCGTEALTGVRACPEGCTQDYPFVPFPPEAAGGSIPVRFEEQVAAHGNKIAVRSDGQALSYHALNQAANQVARAILAQAGDGSEPVALLIGHGAPIIIALFGVLKAGRTYVALDLSSPQDWLATILADSQARLILTNEQNYARAQELSRGDLQVLNMDWLDADLSTENLDLAISPDTVAVLVYTSGSTGQPKGVPRTHRQILFQLIAHTNDLRICASDCQTLLKTPSFGGSVMDIYGTLLNGATLCLYDFRRLGLVPLADWLIEEKITLFTPPVPLFRQFMDTLTGQRQFPHLRLVKLGGQAIYRKDVENFRQHFCPNCLLVHRLSSSEAGIIGQIIIDHQTPIAGDVVPVGYPPPGKEVLILDESGAQVGFDRVGEIAVKSRYLAPGYWRRPDLTSKVFLPDPEGSEARIYLTGDLGIVRPDGCLEYLGRRDSQVKIRGYRVEIAQVELALQSLDGIRDAVVVALEQEPGEKRLVAYVVPANGTTLSASVVRSVVAAKLPHYMIPSSFVIMDRLPLTHTGKVDRAGLPAPDEVPQSVEAESARPRDEVELRLVEIWKALFGIPSVGIHDNFFELGGHSLLAARLFTEIDRDFGKKLPLTTVLQAPTVNQLAERIRRVESAANWSYLLAMQPNGPRPPFFLIHTSGGNLLEYKELAELLGPEQPVYGILPKGQRGEEAPDSRLEDMAAHCVRVMRSAQSAGPYYLGGYCSAAPLAFETARQLEAQGEAVGLLAIFDARAPRQSRLRVPVWHPRFITSFATNLPGWARDSLPGRYGIVLNRIFIRARGKARATWRSATGQSKSSMVDGQALLEDFLGDLSGVPVRTRELMVAHSMASRSYQPQVYHGRLTLFRVRSLPLMSPYDPELDWGRLTTGGVEVKIVSGHHRSLLQKLHVETLAAQLKAVLDQ